MLSKKELYNQAVGELKLRRMEREQLAREHLRHAASVCPEIGRLRAELGRTSIKLTRAILHGDGHSAKLLQKIEEENLQVQQKISEHLRAHNLPQDYLDPPPVCKKCDDYGYLQTGNRIPKQCSCMRQLMNRISAEDLQKSSHLHLTSFADFNLNYFSRDIDPSYHISPYEQMMQVYRTCVDYADRFSRSSPGIIMSGKTGLGKTHLSLAIAAKVISKGFNVLYFTASELTRQMSDRYFGRNKGRDDLLEVVCDADLLILDDLGAEFDSNFSVSAIYDVISGRISAGLPTIVNTNLSPVELEKRYQDRVVSRLFAQMTPLAFIGEDVRSIKARENR